MFWFLKGKLQIWSLAGFAKPDLSVLMDPHPLEISPLIVNLE